MGNTSAAIIPSKFSYISWLIISALAVLMMIFPLKYDIFFLLIKSFVWGVRGKAINKKSLFSSTSSNTGVVFTKSFWCLAYPITFAPNPFAIFTI